MSTTHCSVTRVGMGHHMIVWSCAGPKVLGPDAREWQAWSRGDARCIGRHGLRGSAKGGNGRHK